MNRGKYSKKEHKLKDLSYSSNGKSSRPRSRESSEESELVFPVLKSLDKEILHCYSSVLSRKQNDNAISMDDLDGLQPELETMLSCVAVRLRTLQTELDGANSCLEGIVDRRTPSGNQSRKRKLCEGRNSKSLKDLVKMKENTQADGVQSSENETDNSIDILIDSNTPMEPTAVPQAENDLPNKFWASVEPYFGEITNDSIKLLQEMINTCVNDLDGIKIPHLGEHYTIKWAREDLTQEKDASHPDRPKRKPGEVSTDVKHLLKQANNVAPKERSTGPLVQRLVSALMEENASSPLQDSFNNKFDEDYFAKLPLYHTTLCFERRVRKELEVVGLIDSNTDEVDQILEDLKKCEEEIKIVAKQNKDYLSKILVQAEKEMTRQSIRTKIKAVDNEILEIYKKVNMAKLKKKQLPKKDKEQAWRAMKEREALFKSSEAI